MPGLWRPVLWEEWSDGRLGDVRVHTTRQEADRRQVDLDIEVEAAVHDLSVVATVAGGAATVPVRPGVDHVQVGLTVEDPDLWWPHTHGRPTLHGLHVTLRERDGSPLDTTTLRTGSRDVVRGTGPDESGSRFALVVNYEDETFYRLGLLVRLMAPDVLVVATPEGQDGATWHGAGR